VAQSSRARWLLRNVGATKFADEHLGLLVARNVEPSGHSGDRRSSNTRNLNEKVTATAFASRRRLGLLVARNVTKGVVGRSPSRRRSTVR